MKTTLFQFSFNRGELDPALHGRTDWKYYAAGAERLHNLIIRPQGGVVKRPGLRFVDYALNQEKPSVFIKFVFSVKQSYILEMGDRQMRIIQNGELVVYPDGHEKAGEVVVVETPYSSDDLPMLRYAQVADVMRITISSHRPRLLKRYDHWDWRFDDINLDRPISPPDGLRIVKDGNTGRQYCVTALKSATEESVASDVVIGNEGTGQSLPVPNVAAMNITDCRTYLLGHGQEIPASWNVWILSADALLDWLTALGYSNLTYRNPGDGMKYYMYRPNGAECGPGRGNALTYDMAWSEAMYSFDSWWGAQYLTAARQQILDYVDDFNESNNLTGKYTLEWEPVGEAETYYVFRGVETESGVNFYYIGATEETVFEDDSRPYDSSRGVPVTDNPFDQPGNYPGVCAFFEQRMVYARTDKKPTTFWGSDAGNYDRFGTHTPIQETDSYNFALASGEMNEIQWIVPLNEMLLGTSGSEWKAGGGGAAISPLNVNARPQSFYGCAPMNPVIIGRTVVFVSRSRKNIRSFSYSLEADGYAGKDLTAYAGHLFVGKTIVSMAHQQGRNGILWVVLSDGSLASCTFEPDEDVIAWSRHETAGRFEYCGTLVDADGTDQVYFCVARDINGQTRRFIEMLADEPDDSTPLEEMFFVDSGLSASFDSPQTAVAGLDHLEGCEVVVFADGYVITGLKVSAGRIEFPHGYGYSNIHVGLPYTAQIDTLEMEPMDGGTVQNRSRFALFSTVRFLQTRECFYKNSDGKDFQEMKIRTEGPNQAIQPFTGQKLICFTSPPGARSVRLSLQSGSPTPFGVLGIITEAGYGQSS